MHVILDAQTTVLKHTSELSFCDKNSIQNGDHMHLKMSLISPASHYEKNYKTNKTLKINQNS